GNNEVDPPTATDTRSLHVDFGGDAPGTVKFDAATTQPEAGFTSQGLPITYTVSADGQTLTGSTTAGDVFTAHINADGTYTFTLLKPIDHLIHSGTDDNTDTASFHFNVTATDHDGDTTGAQITAVVADDTPIVTQSTTGSVNEDDLPNGTDTSKESLTT